MQYFNIALIHGTRRQHNLSGHVVQYLLERFKTIPDIQIQLLNLDTYNFPILEERIEDMASVPENLQAFCTHLKSADAVLIVSPEYKNGMPGALKNALDYLPPGHLKRKPLGVCTVSSGPFGGLLCLAQIREVCMALGAAIVPERFLVPFVQQSFNAEGVLVQEQEMNERFDKFWREMYWYMAALQPSAQS